MCRSNGRRSGHGMMVSGTPQPIRPTKHTDRYPLRPVRPLGMNGRFHGQNFFHTSSSMGQHISGIRYFSTPGVRIEITVDQRSERIVLESRRLKLANLSRAVKVWLAANGMPVETAGQSAKPATGRGLDRDPRQTRYHSKARARGGEKGDKGDLMMSTMPSLSGGGSQIFAKIGAVPRAVLGRF